MIYYNIIDLIHNIKKCGDNSIYFKILKLELENGKSPNVICDISGNTALYCACVNDYYPGSFETAKLLLNYGADPNEQNTKGITPLMYTAKYYDTFISNENSKKISKLLLDYGADPNIQDQYGITAIIFASEYGKNRWFEIIKLLLDRGANINHQEFICKDTALIRAMKNHMLFSSLGAVELLLSYGADHTIRNNLGHTYDYYYDHIE